MLNETNIDRLIPISELCKALDCGPKTVERACERHGVPLARFSRSNRGLMASQYALLLERVTGAKQCA